MYTKGKWTINTVKGIRIEADKCICVLGDVEDEDYANANLIAAAPIGDELASAVLDMRDNNYDDFLELRELARKFKAKAGERCIP